MLRWMFLAILSFTTLACAAGPTTQPADQPTDIPQLKKAFEKEAVEKDGVLTLTFPRNDLNLTVDGYDVPGAVAASVIQAWQCPCGRLVMVGQFCVADYESNDVIDALRVDARARIASVAPMLMLERPKVLLIRFQTEGRAPELIKLIKSCQEWMGDARMAPIKQEEAK